MSVKKCSHKHRNTVTDWKVWMTVEETPFARLERLGKTVICVDCGGREWVRDLLFSEERWVLKT